jgi:hypothetical protein
MHHEYVSAAREDDILAVAGQFLAGLHLEAGPVGGFDLVVRFR